MIDNRSLYFSCLKTMYLVIGSNALTILAYIYLHQSSHELFTAPNTSSPNVFPDPNNFTRSHKIGKKCKCRSVKRPPPCSLGVINQIEENINNLDQMNPTLIGYTRVKYLTPPSKLTYNLVLKNSTQHKTYMTEWVLKLLGKETKGRFIEAGANDGEGNSHTLYLEKELGWTGLLVECNPKILQILKRKHRKAWIADVCLSPTSKPGQFMFTSPVGYAVAGSLGTPLFVHPDSPVETYEVQTIPIYTLLAALGWKTVDYLCLDVEGAELDVLKNFPWDKVSFKVISVEVQSYDKNQKEELKDLLDSNGYQLAANLPLDDLFVHDSVKERLEKEMLEKQRRRQREQQRPTVNNTRSSNVDY